MSTLSEIDGAMLPQVAALAAGRETFELLDWRCDSIHAAFNQVTSGLYRVTGTGRDGGQVVSWSLILKIIHASDGPFGGSSERSHPTYWRREALLYESGVLDVLPGLRAPRCFGVDELDGSGARIWLEDVTDEGGSRWPPSRYRRAAQRLGEFNGAYLAGTPLPASGHLSRHWLRSFVETFAPAHAQLPNVRRHPLTRLCWPGGMIDRVIDLWERRHCLLAALDGLPQTFCHLDAFPRNLLVDQKTDDIVAVDWSYAGIAPIGSELAPMVAASACFFAMDPDQMPSIDEIVFDHYVQGLAKAGWHGDPRTVRIGYTAAAALHYGLFPIGVLLTDGPLRTHFEHVFAHPAEEIAGRWAPIAAFLLDQADEAQRLTQ